MTEETSKKVTSEERKNILSRYIATHYSAHNWHLLSQSDFSYVFKKKINHVLHLILSIITFGFWFIVWIILYLVSKGNRIVEVDEFGIVKDFRARKD